MTVVYVDSVFVLNALMDYFLLLATARLAGAPLRRGRYVLAAVFGGAYAAAVFLPGLSALSAPPGKLAAGVLLALIAYGGGERFFRLTLLLFLVSCGFAGCVLGLGLASGGVPAERGIFYTDVDVRVLLMASGAAYAVLSVVFRASARHGVQGELIPAVLCFQGRQVRLTALRDTGNDLRDSATGRPVLVAEAAALRGLWPPELGRLLTMEALRAPGAALLSLEPWRGRFRLTAYSAVGVPSGLLLTVRTDWGEIGGERYEGLTAALCPSPLGDGFSALWGERERRGGHEHDPKAFERPRRTGEASGAAAPVHGPLYRGKRHPAPAPEPGAGSGVGGADRGRGRPAGADRT